MLTRNWSAQPRKKRSELAPPLSYRMPKESANQESNNPPTVTTVNGNDLRNLGIIAPFDQLPRPPLPLRPKASPCRQEELPKGLARRSSATPAAGQQPVSTTETASPATVTTLNM